MILKLYCIFCYFFNFFMILFFYLWDDCALCHLVYLFTTKPPCYCRSRSCPNTLAFDLITFPSWQRFLVVKDFHFRWANCKTKEREGKFSLGVKFNSKAGTYDYTYILELDVSRVKSYCICAFTESYMHNIVLLLILFVCL